MTPEETIAGYRRALAPMEACSIRRYSGTGAGRPHVDYACQARVIEYRPGELAGDIAQGDRRAIVMAQDVSDAGLSLPVTTNDRFVARSKEFVIVALDDNTRRLGSTLIAYELQVRG